MNIRLALYSLVLAVFTAWSASLVWAHGYLGFFRLAVATGPGQQVFVDLVIALSIVLAWMWSDARKRQLSVWPWIVVTLFFGSIGPLGYLVRRELAGAPARS